jgi:hypothetical protein
MAKNNTIKSRSAYQSGIQTGLPTYRKLGSAKHKFREDSFYSLLTIAQLIDISHQAIRGRAFKDKWPMVAVYNRRLAIRKPRFVDGSFLRNAQIQAQEAKTCR